MGVGLKQFLSSNKGLPDFINSFQVQEMVQVEARSGSSRAPVPEMGWKIPMAPPGEYCTCSLLVEFHEKLIIP
jgi:hypothetical protein